MLYNVLVKGGFEPLADTLLEFRPLDFQKAASGSFMAITTINHTAATLIMHGANQSCVKICSIALVHVLLCDQLQLNNTPGDFNSLSQRFRNAEVHRNDTAQWVIPRDCSR